MNITEDSLKSMWVENEAGEKFYNFFEEGVPEGFIYWHSLNPNVLNHEVHRFVIKKEVESCKHKNIVPTGGWVDGIEGRECKDCNGTQTKNIGESWPNIWEANGSRHICTGSSTWSQDLVLAMANSKEYTLFESIIIAASSCERCMNSLAHKYGLCWGYPEFSKEWKECNTQCEYCREYPLPERSNISIVKELGL